MHKYDKNLFKSFHVDFLPMSLSTFHFYLNLYNLKILYFKCVFTCYILLHLILLSFWSTCLILLRSVSLSKRKCSPK